MSDTPWQGDACSLVDAFRAGERSPAEELDAVLAAIAASDLNCFSFLDPDRARAAANAHAATVRFIRAIRWCGSGGSRSIRSSRSTAST